MTFLEAGAKKILRLLPKPHVRDCMLHMALMEAIAHAQPALTAEYIGTTSTNMKPQVCGFACVRILTCWLFHWELCSCGHPWRQCYVCINMG
jgi:hypothetical protein